MNGIDKISDRILSEAKAAERNCLEKAEAQAAVIIGESKTRAEQILNTAKESSAKESENIINRAESSAELIKRNAVLKVKSDTIDKAYLAAEKALINMPKAEYLKLMVKLATEAAKEQIENEKLHAYDLNDDDALPVDVFEIFLNEKDKNEIGNDLSQELEKSLVGENKKVVLSSKSMNIEGGFILKFGDIESNCTVSAIMKQLRGQTEGKVYHTLFD